MANGEGDRTNTGGDGSGRLDGLTAWVERPVRRIAGSDRFNPLPHAGTISVFLLAVVIGTGLYITLFYQYGFDASYRSVLAIEAHPIQRIVRALHRYSSAALVVTSLVHGWRIFVAGRFSVRSRRWRWVTGWAMLLVVWPAGVTGYLLIWDERAGAIADAVGLLIRPFGFGASFAARELSGLNPAATGSTFMVVVWFVHLGLTMIIGWFAFRHLRRNRLAWYPPRIWMALMGLSLLVASLFLPLGMLGPADPTRIGVTVPLDPFVLFLLPILESGWRWPALAALVVVTGVAVGFPFLRRHGQPPPVVVHDDACTGCNLCVLDCPYQALSLIERSTPEQPAARPLAVVDAGACVSCGICLGSCAFDALTLPDPGAAGDGGEGDSTAITETPVALSGPVVVACDRHHDLAPAALAGPAGEPVTHIEYVRCAGAVGVDLVRRMTRAGADSVEVIGCAVGDCRYGLGNTLAGRRLQGEQAPHLPRALEAKVSQRWAAPGDLVAGEQAIADEPHLRSSSRRSLIGAGTVVLASALVVAVATAAPFRGASERAAVQIVVDAESGLDLESPTSEAALGFDETVEAVSVELNGELLGRAAVGSWGGRQVEVAEWPVDPGPARVTVTASGAAQSVVVFDADVSFEPNTRFQVPVRSIRVAPDVAAGRDLFHSRHAGCSVCHSVEEGDDGVGPSLYGVADRAGGRVEGLDAEQYLWQSILLPDQYVVEGYPAGQMLPIYRERLTEEELDAIITYLMSLTTTTATDPTEAGS